jgi:CheY-like chemotaxis protein
VLTRAGAEVRTALSVADALTMLRGWQPGCIISDIGMPDRDGYSFIRELRDLPPPLRTVPVIALTAFARESDRALALEAGFTDHLAKPVNTAALLQKVATLTRHV